jgi:uncharacterized repeat protein (TIGR01451 family)
MKKRWVATVTAVMIPAVALLAVLWTIGANGFQPALAADVLDAAPAAGEITVEPAANYLNMHTPLASFITITKTAPDSAYHGEVITYTIAVRYDTGSSVCSVFIADDVPGGAAYVGHEPPLQYNPEPEGVSWLGDLDPGTHITFTWWVSVTGAPGDTILNQIVPASSCPCTPIITAETHITTPTLKPSIGVNLDRAAPGDTLEYTIHIVNEGLTTTAYLADYIPTALDYAPGSVWASSGVAGFDPDDGVINWFGEVSTGGEVQVGFEATVSHRAAAGQPIVNVAWIYDEVTGDEHELDVTTIVSTSFKGYDNVGKLAVDTCWNWECEWYECSDPCDDT